MKNQPFATLALLIGLCIASYGQTSQAIETQPIVRLKSTLDVSGVSVFNSKSTNLQLVLTSSSPLLDSASRLILLQGKTSLQLVDISTGEIKRTFTGLQGLPILSPSAQKLLIIDKKSSSVLSVKTGEKLCDLSEPPKEPSEAKWSPDEKSIMLMKLEDGFKASLLDKQRTVAHVYDAETGKLKFTIKIKSTYARFIFGPNSESILTSSDKEEAKLWDASTGQLRATLKASEGLYTESSARFSPDGRLIVVGSYWRGTSLWDASTVELKAELTGSNFGGTEYHFQGFSPDGKLMLFYHEHMKGLTTIYRSFELRDAETGVIKSVLKVKNIKDYPDQIQWSADSTTLFTATGRNAYYGHIWDVKNGKLLVAFPLIKKYSRIPFDFGYKDRDSVSFHPTLPLITIVNNNSVRFLNPLTGEVLQTIDNASHPAKWTTDGQLLMTNTKDGKTVQIWELVHSATVKTQADAVVSHIAK